MSDLPVGPGQGISIMIPSGWIKQEAWGSCCDDTVGMCHVEVA